MRTVNHLFAARTGDPGRICEQLLLNLKLLGGFVQERRTWIALQIRLPCQRGGAVNRQGAEVLVFALCRRATGVGVGRQLVQHCQRFGIAFFPKQQVGQGLAQADVAGVLHIQGFQLLDGARTLPGDIAANAQVFQSSGKVWRGIAKQLFKNGRRLFRATRSGIQTRLLQLLLGLRVLQFHQILCLTQCQRVRRQFLQMGQTLLGQVRIFVQQGLTH